METVTQFIIVSLATYRLSRMIASERGTWDVFHKLRAAVYKRYPDIFTSISTTSTGQVIENATASWQFDGITCVDCLSFWLAWITALAMGVYGVDYVVYSLAISAVCVLINHNSK